LEEGIAADTRRRPDDGDETIYPPPMMTISVVSVGQVRTLLLLCINTEVVVCGDLLEFATALLCSYSTSGGKRRSPFPRLSSTRRRSLFFPPFRPGDPSERYTEPYTYV